MGYPIQHIVGFDGQTYDIGGGGATIRRVDGCLKDNYIPSNLKDGDIIFFDAANSAETGTFLEWPSESSSTIDLHGMYGEIWHINKFYINNGTAAAINTKCNITLYVTSASNRVLNIIDISPSWASNYYGQDASGYDLDLPTAANGNDIVWAKFNSTSYLTAKDSNNTAITISEIMIIVGNNHTRAIFKTASNTRVDSITISTKLLGIPASYRCCSGANKYTEGSLGYFSPSTTASGSSEKSNWTVNLQYINDMGQYHCIDFMHV